MKNILIVGSLNMDYTIYMDNFPRPGETIFGKDRFIQAGGKGNNQTIAVAKSGLVNTFMIGAVGNDSDGKAVLDILKNNNVKGKIITKDNVPTGNATIFVQKDSENQIVIIAGANGAITVDDIDVKLIEDCDYIILQNVIPMEINEFVMKKGHELGKVIIYNPAPYREINDDLFSLIDYFIPNETELERYTMTNDIDSGINKMLTKGVKNVLVTLGSHGSKFQNQNESYVIPAIKVNAIDTVAAGDTFVGYFASCLASGKDVKTSIQFATKASSITVTRKGSLVSIPFGKEVF